jgi:rubrerythrin
MIQLRRRSFLQGVAGVAIWSSLTQDGLASETMSLKEVTMPEFGSPFSGMKADRKLSKAELIRAIRFMVSAEYEAVQLYMQLAESIDDELAKEVLIDIADEERVHAGEFLRVLKHLAPDEEKFYKEGEEEVEEIIEKRGLK